MNTVPRAMRKRFIVLPGVAFDMRNSCEAPPLNLADGMTASGHTRLLRMSFRKTCL